MKLKLITLSALSLFTTLSWGQTLLYNDGATIKVQTGATLYVEGGVQNTATGTIDNDGLIEIKGNFLNQGNWEASQPNTLKFSGNVNSDVTSGTAQFHDVVVQKDAGFNVNLMDHMTINNNLNFNAAGGSQVVTGSSDVIFGSAATVTGYDSDEYIATTSTGMVQKSVTANGTFEFPIGDGSNYSPLTSVYTGTGYSSANLRSRVNDSDHNDLPMDATDYLTRYWDINATGITGYSNLLTGTYVPSDVFGSASLIKGAVWDGTEWSYADASTTGFTVTGSTNDATADYTGSNFFGKVLVKLFLQGPYNASTGLMSTTLSNNATIEALMLTSPYTDAPASVGDIPSTVTDWVKLELRDPASPSTILGKASVFLKNDGTVVGLDGTSTPTVKNGLSTSIVGVVHRNHLFIRTPDAGINVVTPTLHDFSANLANAYDNPAVSNDAMNLISGTFPAYTMWAGNANTTNATAISQVRYAGLNNDNAAILNAVGGSVAGILSNVYHQADLNLNGVVRYAGLNNDNAVLLNALGGNVATIRTHHQ